MGAESLNFSIDLDTIKKNLEEKKACIVLITCDDPNEDGKMNVQLTCEGDLDLAALLLETAQAHLFDAEPL